MRVERPGGERLVGQNAREDGEATPSRSWDTLATQNPTSGTNISPKPSKIKRKRIQHWQKCIASNTKGVLQAEGEEAGGPRAARARWGPHPPRPRGREGTGTAPCRRLVRGQTLPGLLLTAPPHFWETHT